METHGSSSSTSYGQVLEVTFDVVREGVGGSQAQPVRDGDTMTGQDLHKVVFQFTITCCIDIAQVEATGRVDPIFPSRYASGGNPVQAYTSYSVPAGTDWFYLDNNVGVETIYVMASREWRSDLQEILAQLEYRKQSLVQQQVQMNQYTIVIRGIGGGASRRCHPDGAVAGWNAGAVSGHGV
jgi:hypothetical protein